MSKKAFSLFEVVVSLVLLSLILLGSIKILDKNNNYETYKKLQGCENSFYEKKVLNCNKNVKFIQY